MGPDRGVAVTVIIADDDERIRAALGDLIERHEGLDLAGAVADGESAVELAAELHPSVAVIDVRMPGGGLAAVAGIRTASPDTAIVVYTAFDDPRMERDARAAGAVDYLRKGDRTADIISAILAAATGAGRQPTER